MNPTRRRIMAGFAAGIATGIARAQNRSRTYRIGFVYAGRREESMEAGEGPFLRRLNELGYTEGRNLVVDRRYADGKLERLPALAAELVAEKPDLIFAPQAPATAAVKATTNTTPIVFCLVSDPVALGFAQTLARPGGNLTGMSNFSVEIVGKRIEILRQLAPEVGKLALWFNPVAMNDDVERRAAEQAAARMNMQVLGVRARTPAEFEEASAATRRWGADCIYFNSNPTYAANRTRLVAVAAELKLPASYVMDGFVEAGGLFAYAASFAELSRRSADYADRILRGAKPGELPVEQPVSLELTLNLNTARELGLTVPQSLLLRATRVIGRA